MHTWFYQNIFSTNKTRECSHCHKIDYWHPAQVWITLVNPDLFQSTYLRIKALQCKTDYTLMNEPYPECGR